MDDRSEKAAFLAQVDVSRETTDRLELYAALLRKWNPAINLVAPSTLAQLWPRHFLDSAQLLALAPEGATTWLDLGSGGGFPGAVIAILAAEARPDISVTCIESDLRKATFLRTIARETEVNFQVVAERIENASPQSADIISARALARLPVLLPLVSRHLAPTGRALLLKGAGYRAELKEAVEKWAFDIREIPSKTDGDAVVLSLGDLQRV